MVSFAELLRGFRGARGLTQEDLAERSGLSVYAISMLERGVRTAPRSSTVELLARALELDPAERAALAAAARARPTRSVAIPAEPRSRAGGWSVSVLSLPCGFRVTIALACLVAVLVIGARNAWYAARPGSPPPTPPLPVFTSPPPPSAIVYLDASDRTLLRRIGYDGRVMPGTWSTTDRPMLTMADPVQPVVGVSPDGEHAVTFDRSRQNWQIVDAQNQVVTSVLNTIDSPEFGIWAGDSRHVCRLGIIDPGGWQVVVSDVLDPGSPGSAVPVSSVTYPPYVTIAACDPTAGRAVLVEPLTDTVPAPNTAPRVALGVDLAKGTVVTRVPIGDATHGVQFSLDGRYLAAIDYARRTSSIVSLVAGRTVAVVNSEVRGFSADDSRVVVNSVFEPLVRTLGTTRVVDWPKGRVLASRTGWTNKVRAQPGGAALAMNVMRTAPGGPTDLVIVPAAGSGALLRDVTML
jgi:transcriptional regulator with XRE-family HTH domain